MNGGMNTGAEYPPEAYAPNGELWWKLQASPGSKRRFGDEQKIAAWLAFNRSTGETFTMRALRAALGEDRLPNSAEHLNRRLRTLRTRDGWVIPSAKDDGSLAHDEYRVKKMGWHPGIGTPRSKNDLPSDKMRRLVFERDKSTCVICGVASKEPYDDMPEKNARMTLGHRIPGRRATSEATVDELQTECARCNETVRDEIVNPITLDEVWPSMRQLKRGDKEQLLRWLEQGRRSKTKVDDIYADARRLSWNEREVLLTELRAMVGK